MTIGSGRIRNKERSMTTGDKRRRTEVIVLVSRSGTPSREGKGI